MTTPKDTFIRFYDEFRDCEFNKEFYSRRTEHFRLRLRLVDIIIALFLAGFGITGLTLWKTEIYGFAIGQISLGVCATLAVILFTIKPYLKWEDKAETLSNMTGTYYSLSHVHRDLVRRVQEHRGVDERDETIFETLRELRGALASREEPNPPTKLKALCQNIVNERYPADKFYYPADPTGAP